MSDVKHGNPGTDRLKSLDFILRVFGLEFEEDLMLLLKIVEEFYPVDVSYLCFLTHQ